MCCKRLSSPRCRSELIDSAWVVIVPGQKYIKKIDLVCCTRIAKENIMSDRLKISTKRPKKRRDFCKRVNIDDDSSHNVDENSSNSVQDGLLLSAESEVDVHVVQEATISSEKVEEIPVNDTNDAKRLCGCRFMDLDILSAVFKGLNCHTNGCESDLVFSENSKNKKRTS